MTTEVRRNPLLAIEAVCPKSHEVVYQFDRLCDAVAAGFVASSIRPCLAGGIVNHAGLWWRMIGDDTPIPVDPNSRLTDFIDAQIFYVSGALLPYGEFRERFLAWLPAEERHAWSAYRITRMLPQRHASGVGNRNRSFIINAAWEKLPAVGPPCRVSRGRVRRD